MTAKYPPIAPRGPNAAGPSGNAQQSSEIIPQQLQAADVSDEAGQLARLLALEAAPAGFVDAHHPVRDAVTLALQKPAGELIKRYAQRQRALKEAMGTVSDSDDPGEPGVALVDDDGRPAIVAMAETQVAMALLGDAKAFNAVADRVEGKAGLRKADLDAETLAQRQRVRGTIEEIVREMSERRRGLAADARVIDVDVAPNDDG